MDPAILLLSVVTQITKPELTLAKKHNIITNHIMGTTEHSIPKHSKMLLTVKTSTLTSAA
jgi:hypothetical protein